MKNTQKEPCTPWVEESLFGIWFLGTYTWVRSVLRRALDDLVTLIPNRKYSYSTVLDIGFGHGNSFWLLDEYFHPNEIIGIDIDPKSKARSRDNIKKCRSKVTIMLSDAAFLDLDDHSIDMIFCHQSFHHLVNQEKAVNEFYRVLKPGGVFLFAESCKRYIHSFWIRFLFRHPMHVQKTDLEYIDLISKVGFTIKPESISRPFLWWSLTDLGLLSYFGITKKEIEGEREETMINLVACKPLED